MATLWIIEKEISRDSSLATSLMGDFAVRVFQTWGSYLKLAKNSKFIPDGVLVNLIGIDQEFSAIRSFIDFQFPEIAKFYFSEAFPEVEILSSSTFKCPIGMNSLELATMVGRCLKGVNSRAKRGALRFQDIALDPENMVFQIIPHGEKSSLTKIEAKLLKIFLENPGKCIKRQDISQYVWDGVKVSPRTIDSHVSRLRKRIEGSEAKIDGIYGDGYVLRSP